MPFEVRPLPALSLQNDVVVGAYRCDEMTVQHVIVRPRIFGSYQFQRGTGLVALRGGDAQT